MRLTKMPVSQYMYRGFFWEKANQGCSKIGDGILSINLVKLQEQFSIITSVFRKLSNTTDKWRNILLTAHWKQNEKLIYCT